MIVKNFDNFTEVGSWRKVKNLVIFVRSQTFQRLALGESEKLSYFQRKSKISEVRVEKTGNIVYFEVSRKFQRLNIGENWKQKKELSFF